MGGNFTNFFEAIPTVRRLYQMWIKKTRKHGEAMAILCRRQTIKHLMEVATVL